ncbi:flagellar protein FlgN [Schnuerera sp. xch1]|uniref:flagellar protein FlgN n=1 Tax=Schnuerera sp. xch1 TaxID=2874283 RepID=UPI001CC008F5|nr:flagellar protein FlgN [Schnuerera sp. xch1]MBZ2174820.1 flagellar protein FlgN [Schnuerera sp. xch1]
MTFKEELISILKEELECIKSIKKLTFQKTDTIINSHVEELEQITKREEALINKMALAEEKRIKLLDTWGVDKNTPLSDIIDKIDEEKKDIMELGEKLSKLLADIQSRNSVNNELINENLQWLDFNINLITQAGAPATYDKKNKKEKTNKNLFDRKV